MWSFSTKRSAYRPIEPSKEESEEIDGSSPSFRQMLALRLSCAAIIAIAAVAQTLALLSVGIAAYNLGQLHQNVLKVPGIVQANTIDGSSCRIII